MADRVRLVTFSAGGRPVVVRDLEDGADFRKVAESFAIAAPGKRQSMAGTNRRYGGSRQVGESHDNGAVAWTAMVSGATADAALVNAEGLISDLEVALGGRYLEFRPDGATRSVFFEVRGTAEWTPKYKWREFAGAQLWVNDVKIPVAPLALLEPMDVRDDFSVDTGADYAFDSGAAVEVAISGGQLTAVSSLAVEKRMAHTARGYSVLDAQDTVKGAPGATITSFKLGVELRRSAAGTYLDVYVDDNGANSRLRVDKVVAGARTNLTSTNLAARVVAGTALWVRGRVEGNVVTAEHFATVPTPMGAPATTNSVVLSAAEQAALVAGTGGIVWIPQHAAATVDDFEHMPYTYRSLTLPEYLSLGGPIPGSAPALADLHLTHSGGAAAPVWALMGWAERPAPYNLMWNGDFEEDVNGWSVALVTGVQAVAGTSITRDTAATARTKYGAANAIVVTPASAGAGANFPIYRRFRKGVTYTATLFAAAAASTTAMVLKLGVNGDVATSAATALGAGLVQWTVTWTPTADREVAYLSFQTNAATATTCNIDGVVCFEGPVAPTLGRHAEGAGAVPPFGIIEMESADTGDIAGWAITTDVGSRVGNRLLDPAVAGVKTYTAGWWIDPALLVADDFSQGEIDIEFWARLGPDGSNVSPRAILSARPEWGTAFGAERFTNEHQAAGKLLIKPSGTAQYRPVRLGTITFPVDVARPARWKLWLTCSTAAGSTGLFSGDYIIAVPAGKRVAGASGKANNSSYPGFIASTAETTRIVTSQLQGLVAKPPLPAQPVGGALGGPTIGLPSGNVDLVVKLASVVPDDPTSDATGEQLAHAATVHVAVTPRAYLVRGT